MKKYGLYKKDKLCSAVDIQALFAGGGADFSALAYPLRAVARDNSSRWSDARLKFLISVPKKRLRHAVERVLVRRRVREAFRLARPEFSLPGTCRMDLAFVYVGKGTASYHDIEKAVRKLMALLVEHISRPRDTDDKADCQ